ncbi:NCLX protein, partial [Nothocercus julius]|nr:NCLX protein [Nothocercus julius]
LQCWEVRRRNSSEWCRFIRTNPDCRLESGFLDYLDGVFCAFPARLLPLAVTLYACWLLYLFIILGVTAEKFEPTCPRLTPRRAAGWAFSLTSVLHGVTFLAFGNGAPDVFSAVVAFSDPRTAGLAIGAVFGAGVYVTTVVAGGIALVKPFTAASRPFLRDIIFYMVAVFLTFVVLYLGRIRLGEALGERPAGCGGRRRCRRGRRRLHPSLAGYLGLYIFYVITVVLCTWIHRRQRADGLAPPRPWEPGRGRCPRGGGGSLGGPAHCCSPRPPELLTDTEEQQSTGAGSGDYGEEYRPLLPYQESSLRVLAAALSPVDCRKWRRKPWYWRLFKVLKVSKGRPDPPPRARGPRPHSAPSLQVPVELLLLLTVPVVDPDKEDLNWKRPLNCLHVVTGPLLCILTLKSGAYGLYQIQGVFPVWVLVALLGTIVAVLLFSTTSNEEPPKYHCVFAFLGFLVSAMWINAAATELVNILRTLGIIFQLSNTVLGLTLLAWGNSIGGEGPTGAPAAAPEPGGTSGRLPFLSPCADTFSDLTMARQGYPRMAFSACFGGIIFNILVGVGLGCLLQMSASQVVVKLEPDGLLVWILAGALGLSLAFSLAAVPAQCFQLGTAHGACLLLYYAAFLAVALLTEFGVIRAAAA